MASDFSIKAHDQLPSIQATLTTATGTPVDLTGATGVKFIMTTATGVSPKVASAAVIVAPATNGVVRYDWATVDTNAPGNYVAEWEVTWSGGKKQTFPTLTYHSVAVLADLDNA